MKKNAFLVVGIQAIVAIICATAAYFIDNPLAAKSALFGSTASLANGLMLAWHGLERSAKAEPGEHLKAMYRSSLERYTIVILLLAAGLRFLGLAPLLVLAGFVAGQAGLILASLLWNGFEKKNG
ncbi:MAG TPA: ATP synthase subunit I [Burkholderiales bacterium]|nr:ATP synthase subunit I [Burkholderiales bacterium]